MEEYAEKINMDELFIRKQQLDNLKLKTFKKILNRAHKKIKITSRQKAHEPWCFFIVPEFIVGIPRYDTAACTAYIMDKLNENGFYLKYTHPNLLFISWQHYIEKGKREDFKKIYGYSIDGFGRAIKDKTKMLKDKTYVNPNTILMKGISISTTNEKPAKDYKQISTYKPTGNLIYNRDLLKKIEIHTQK